MNSYKSFFYGVLFTVVTTLVLLYALYKTYIAHPTSLGGDGLPWPQEIVVGDFPLSSFSITSLAWLQSLLYNLFVFSKAKTPEPWIGRTIIGAYGGTITSDRATTSPNYVQLMYVPAQDVYLVLCRGTQTKIDVNIDLDISQCPWIDVNGTPRGLVHTGFATLASNISAPLFPNIPDDARQIVFCGHSMGSAVTAILALRWKERHPDCHVSAVMFASPRCMDPALAIYARNTLGQSNITSIINDSDIVPTLPWSVMSAHGQSVTYSHIALNPRVSNTVSDTLAHAHDFSAYARTLENTFAK